ncbi:hypothetical protein WICPIJ_006150 [Wickerhamomyces pijperi]|uniref:Uncharacterized protein n=1 Tax=Wickerhamomyces pijperi TaxID=599730 RepID=A0A9P8TL95_WICPI|nr:hypothetical protein WICPIJ_006150 [Wickerhamomyces pijperi]
MRLISKITHHRVDIAGSRDQIGNSGSGQTNLPTALLVRILQLPDVQPIVQPSEEHLACLLMADELINCEPHCRDRHIRVVQFQFIRLWVKGNSQDMDITHRGNQQQIVDRFGESVGCWFH